MKTDIYTRIVAEDFVPLGWFEPGPQDSVPGPAGTVILIGNAGPAMFARFARERDPATDTLDDWCRERLGPLAASVGAQAVFPFDKPPYPFLKWAQRAGAGHPSKLGMNIHHEYGLWHAFRAAFIFPQTLDLPDQEAAENPCDTCADQPCQTACPVSAFDAGWDGSPYDVDKCETHLGGQNTAECLTKGCLARLACPVGAGYRYGNDQMLFHLSAFIRARTVKA